jgi:hypothetical protein
MHPVDDQTTVWSCAAQTQHISDGSRDDFRHDKGEQRPSWTKSGIVSDSEHEASMSAMDSHDANLPSRCAEEMLS